jgi:hypothetical protein
MTAEFETVNGKLKVTFWYQADLAKTQAILEDATEYLWNHGYATGDFYNDLTNQEKLDIVDKHVKRVILDLANSFKSTEAQRIAREIEEDDPHMFD